MTEPVADTSQDMTQTHIEQLRTLFPHIFSEGKIDFDKLRHTLGDIVDDRPERYSFSWAGKKDAIRLLQTPTRATLTPTRDESINFDDTQHIFIEGENLEVLKLLYRSYYGRVKMVYIDPPYNTGNGFIYSDDYADPLKAYLKRTGQQNGNGDWLTSNPETNGRYHSVWLSMMYPRLFVARQLLRDDGVVFVSIDDNEVHNLQLVMNEIFGEENRIGIVCWRNVTDNNPTLINKDNEFIICYAKNKIALPQFWKSTQSDAKNLLLQEYEKLKEINSNTAFIELELRDFISDNHQILENLTRYKHVDEYGVYTGSESVHNPRAGGYDFDVLHPTTKKPMRKPANGYRFPETTFRGMEEKGVIIYGEDENRIVKIKKYLHDFEDTLRSVIKLDGRLGTYDLKRVFDITYKIFDNPKPVALLKKLISFITDRDDIIIDLFSGSGSLAQAVFELNSLDKGARKTISIQLPEPVDTTKSTGKNAYKLGLHTIAEIGKERIRRVIIKMKPDDEGRLPLDYGDEDLGFRVFKLAASNFRQWPGYRGNDFEEYAKQMEMFIDPLLDPSAIENTIFEVALKEGFSLTAHVEKVDTNGENSVYRVHDRDKNQSFHICLDNRISSYRLVYDLGLERDDLFICRDVALDDTNMANLALNCRLKTL